VLENQRKLTFAKFYDYITTNNLKQYKFEALELDEIHFLAWTTTPWTLPSNTALTVGPKIEYVLVKTFNQYTFQPINIILAKNLVGKQLSKNYFESSDCADFENFKEGDKKIPFEMKGIFLLPNCDLLFLGSIHFVSLLHIKSFIKLRNISQRTIYSILGRRMNVN